MTLQQNVVFSTIGAVCGAVALVAYAGAAHGGENHLGTIAPILLAHAPTFLVLSLLAPKSRTAMFGGAAMTIGLVLFCGDLVIRDLTGDKLFSFAAPTGGAVLILSWLTIAFTGWSSVKRSNP